MSKLEPGKYEAKILDYGVVQGNKAPQVKVVFGIKNGPSYSWFGQLGTEKSQEITTKNLITMGANPSNIEKVENGLNSGVLDTNKVFEIVVADRTYNGKTYTEIKYINDPSTPRGPVQEFTKGTGVLAALKGQAASLVASGAAKPATATPKDDISF
jgi:hypothetical protein